MTNTQLPLILLSVTLSACAQYVLKMGVTGSVMSQAFQTGVLEVLKTAALSPLIWLGMLIYVVGFFLWLWVLSHTDLSMAYPFVGLSFLLTMLFGVLLLGETVGMGRLIGTLLIVAGCILVGRSG